MDALRGAGAVGLVFGLVIFIHELGHFLAAKLMGVYAPRFSIGFGPALWSRKWGETEYILAAFPLGGFVRMASRDDETMAFIEGGAEQPAAVTAPKRPRYWDSNGMAPFGPRPVPADRWFESKSRLARLFILIAGVTMNLLLGYAIYTGLAVILGRPVLATRIVGLVEPLPAAPGLTGALSPGDTIRAVNETAINSWTAFRVAIDSLPGDTLLIRTQRAAIAVPAGPAHGPGRLALLAAIWPATPPVLDQVIPRTPAERAGLRAGDSIIAIDGLPVRYWREVQLRIEPAAGRELRMQVTRNGAVVAITVRPDSATLADPDVGTPRVVGRIGTLARQPQAREPIPLSAALALGAQQTAGAAGFGVLSLRMLLSGQASFRDLGGPVAIGGEAVRAARRGWEDLLSWLALISINIAIMNLLPIPVLDGGQILLLSAEAVKGGAIGLRTREYLMRAGIVMILLLLIVVMSNDIRNLVQNLLKP